MLLRNADAAMYAAKYRGKNEVHCYRAEVTATARQRLDLQTHLRRALERREFRLLYQPQVTRDRKLAALEVLLVWEHPELGHIAPMQFIPIAEETGMILQIGSWVLGEACRTVSQWQRELGRSVPVSVNVSAIQFAQANFVDTVRDALAANGLSAGCLELELTESLVMRDVEQATAIMSQLRDLGVVIAIDDFGTGYSSLSYLKQLPAGIVKLDASFLAIENEKSAYAVVNAVSVLGHTFGLKVTAEGVETEAQFDLVCRAGCDRIQGHLFGAAHAPSRIRELLLAH
jgi:EAL domain-containing protein (putative c-di-GMP-specific phosphodiesterase class I)